MELGDGAALTGALGVNDSRGNKKEAREGAAQGDRGDRWVRGGLELTKWTGPDEVGPVKAASSKEDGGPGVESDGIPIKHLENRFVGSGGKSKHSMIKGLGGEKIPTEPVRGHHKKPGSNFYPVSEEVEDAGIRRAKKQRRVTAWFTGLSNGGRRKRDGKNYFCQVS